VSAVYRQSEVGVSLRAFERAIVTRCVLSEFQAAFSCRVPSMNYRSWMTRVICS